MALPSSRNEDEGISRKSSQIVNWESQSSSSTPLSIELQQLAPALQLICQFAQKITTTTNIIFTITITITIIVTTITISTNNDGPTYQQTHSGAAAALACTAGTNLGANLATAFTTCAATMRYFIIIANVDDVIDIGNGDKYLTATAFATSTGPAVLFKQ